jgi:uncharacterized protein (DUF362 family)
MPDLDAVEECMAEKSFVIITDAPEMNYLRDYVCLPKDYGTPAYFERADVRAIRETVYRCLDDLDGNIHFTEKIRDRRVLIKPNLVGVYHRFGFKDADYPESTDPRVFDAVISFLYRFTKNIVIIESSGEGLPTAGSFKISGLDRVAKQYGIGCVPLETLPVVRYILPRAEVMREVYLPEILDEVVRGEAFYVSVPKMKTNLYTGVTLGFKNAMGILPYKLRQRNHTYLINKKLVDLLYLIKPDLTVIDGIIGGEGNTPGPVDPVDVRVIISGNNSVEVDRVTTRMMGIDPDQNKLMVEAVKRGFNDPSVTVIGTQKVAPFRPANSSVIDAEFRRDFPGVKTLVGYTLNDASQINDVYAVTPEMVLRMEKACDGGCLPAAKTAFEMMKYAPNCDRSFEFILIMGNGVNVDGKTYYFDAAGKAYDLETIQKMPGRKATVGECTRGLKPFCEVNGEGCCSPSSTLNTIFKAARRTAAPYSPRNIYLGMMLFETLKLMLQRRALIQKGRWVDVPYAARDEIFAIPPLTGEQTERDFISFPLPPMTPEIKKQLLKDTRPI